MMRFADRGLFNRQGYLQMEMGMQGSIVLVQGVPQAPAAHKDAFMAGQQLVACSAQLIRLGLGLRVYACSVKWHLHFVCKAASRILRADRLKGAPGELRKSALVYCAASPCCRWDSEAPPKLLSPTVRNTA